MQADLLLQNELDQTSKGICHFLLVPYHDICASSIVFDPFVLFSVANSESSLQVYMGSSIYSPGLMGGTMSSERKLK